MGIFLTAKAEIVQADKAGIWQTSHNQLFMDDDKQIYLVPRHYFTDGYTIPTPVAMLGGEKLEFDIRPSTGHDFECQYHQELAIKLTKDELWQQGFLRIHKNEYNEELMVCDDIPLEFLDLRSTTFTKANAKFLRMMQSTNAIKKWRASMMFVAVHLNIGWLFSGKKPFNINNIYKCDP